MNKKQALMAALIVVLAAVLARRGPADAQFHLAVFSVDVTPPPGHPGMGGGIMPARSVDDPLYAKGFVLSGGGHPWVLVSFDWCEIRGTSFDKWQSALALAAGTLPERVMIHSTHVHDAPVMDEDAEKLLREMEATGAWREIPAPPPDAPVQNASVCWPDFNEQCIQHVAEALRASLTKARRVTHIGMGRAEVSEVAGNRRFVRPDGTVSYARGSRTTDAEARAADAGTVDPRLRTLSFWEGEQALCALHGYAVHPMSVYGQGRVSADFPGLARERMQREHPDIFQIYASGCSGNVTAGKWNSGGEGSREELAAKLQDAMRRAWQDTRRAPLTRADFHQAFMPLGARNTPGHTEAVLRGHLARGERPFQRSEAAMGLAWYERVRRGHQVRVPCVDLGPALVLLLPAEAYVEFQIFAQECRPESFVFTLGYGECGPGYIPIERAWEEKDSNLNGWTWVPPGSEAVMRTAIRAVLTPRSESAP
ncbi:MAG TPA: hypothetical protein PK490_05530 [Prosthecobacter sp.]|nr:hypothetical protein [Prosthecobacter sp.]HRK13726.1 hypothetical protein [Prosthecobacter sp.]